MRATAIAVTYNVAKVDDPSVRAILNAQWEVLNALVAWHEHVARDHEETVEHEADGSHTIDG